MNVPPPFFICLTTNEATACQQKGWVVLNPHPIIKGNKVWFGCYFLSSTKISDAINICVDDLLNCNIQKLQRRLIAQFNSLKLSKI